MSPTIFDPFHIAIAALLCGCAVSLYNWLQRP